MYLLYPRLPLPVAEAVVLKRAVLSVEELLEQSDIFHENIQFAPTGGNKVTEHELRDLQQAVRNCAEQFEYPNLTSDDAARQFDVDCGILLHQNMRLHPSEASHLEMWAFMGCILLPDVVRWRFFSDQTARERFIGEDRGLRRHTFGRLWWRSYLLHQPHWEEPFDLLNYLYEDDLVQITERNSIAANPHLASAFALSFLKAVEQYDEIPRRQLIREASKRLFRLLSMISFDSLDNDMLQNQMDQIFVNTADSLVLSQQRGDFKSLQS